MEILNFSFHDVDVGDHDIGAAGSGGTLRPRSLVRSKHQHCVSSDRDQLHLDLGYVRFVLGKVICLIIEQVEQFLHRLSWDWHHLGGRDGSNGFPKVWVPSTGRT